jgi:hypothetical protein
MPVEMLPIRVDALGEGHEVLVAAGHGVSPRPDDIAPGDPELAEAVEQVGHADRSGGHAVEEATAFGVVEELHGTFIWP